MNQTVVISIQQYVFLTQGWLVYCFLNIGAHNGFCFFYETEGRENWFIIISLLIRIQRTVR